MVPRPLNILAMTPTHFELRAIEKVIERYNCTFSISGVGPVETAHRLTRLIEAERPDVVLMCGLGGLYCKGNEFEPGVFVAETEILADLGRCTMDGLLPLEIEGQGLEQCFDLSMGWTMLTKDDLLSQGFSTARMATVSCVSADRARAQYISGLYRVRVENMEGASAALVCSHYDICLFEIRAISNIAGESDHSTWKIETALNRLSEEVDRFLGFLYT